MKINKEVQDNREFLVEKKLAFQNIHVVELRIPNGEDAEKKLMSVLEILKEKVDVSIISLGEECKEKEVFLWFVETHGNMLVLQLRPTMPEGKVPEMVSVITRVLEEIESDAECFIVYDLFINPNNFDEVAEEIVKNRGYELNTFGDDKDIGYIKKPFLNIEIHKELKYDYDKGYDYYKGAFQRLMAGDNACELNMTNEDFYVYILSHSAHHFENGGTGIRNILDHF